MFDDKLMSKEMLIIGYIRRSKYVYEASWGSRDVEHFVYLGEDLRGYLTANFGLRSPLVEEFAIDSIIKYGHPNRRMIRRFRDPETACSIRFEFDRIGGILRGPWRRIRTSDIAGADLATFVTRFISEHVLPLVKRIIQLNDYLAFLVADTEPTPWFVSGPAIRAAQVVAIATELGMEKDAIRNSLVPHERLISVDLNQTEMDPAVCVDNYLDRLLSDWATRADRHRLH